MNYLIIMRGIPGCGKSTMLKALQPDVVGSADFFFEKTGEYIFDGSKLPEAHNECWETVTKAILAGVKIVAVDNTNTQRWEYQRYIDFAEARGYVVNIVDLFDGGFTDEELAARNTHGVPLEAIRRMRARYER